MTWTTPIRIGRANPIFRARVVASGMFVPVVGSGTPTPDATLYHFRSTDGGTTWAPAKLLADELGAYGGGQTVAVAVDGQVVHVAYTKTRDGVGAGDSLYIRSTDDGATRGAPVVIGETSAERDPRRMEARRQQQRPNRLHVLFRPPGTRGHVAPSPSTRWA